jgi:N-acetylmuramic acid 6-phosphate etherase
MTTTEQPNPNTAEIDRLSTLDALQLINAEDKKVADAIAQVLPAIAQAVDAIVERLARGGRLIYIGTGTSGRLGVLDASECPPTFGVSPELVQGIIAGGYEACYKAVEASEDDRAAGAVDLQARNVNATDVVVGIAASGRTPYTIGAVEYAREIGALTACITCNANTALAAAVESYCWFDTAEIRHGTKVGVEYAFDPGDGAAGLRQRQSHGKYANQEYQAARTRCRYCAG